MLLTRFEILKDLKESKTACPMRSNSFIQLNK